MSIFDIFKPAPVVTPVQQVAAGATPTTVPAGTDPAAVPQQQGNIPAVPAITTNPDGTPVVAALPEPIDESPLAPFKSLWETAPVDPNASPEPAAYIPPTADEIQKAVAKADFTKGITTEQLEEVTSGGDGAAAALQKLLNSVGQQSLAQSTMVSAKLSEQAMKAALAIEVAKMPGLVRAQTVQAHLKDTNPLFDNPAIKPIIAATQQQLITKFPNATPAEISKMTQEFVLAMGEQFAPKPKVETGLAADDWTGYLENG